MAANGDPLTGDEPKRWAAYWDKHGREEATFVLHRSKKKVGNFVIAEPFLYDKGDGTGYLVPRHEHFECDLASIPTVFTWLVPKDGAHTPAAIVHDTQIDDAEYLHAKWTEDEGWTTEDCPTPEEQPVSAAEADRTFRNGMGQLGVPLSRRWIIWAAVSLRTLCLEGGWPSRIRYGALIALMVVVTGVIGCLGFLDLIPSVEAPGVTLFGIVVWPGGDNLVWWGELLRWLGIGAVAVIVMAPFWWRRAGVELIAGTTIVLVAFPIVIAAVGWALFQIIDALIYLVTDQSAAAAPPLVRTVRMKAKGLDD